MKRQTTRMLALLTALLLGFTSFDLTTLAAEYEPAENEATVTEETVKEAEVVAETEAETEEEAVETVDASVEEINNDGEEELGEEVAEENGTVATGPIPVTSGGTEESPYVIDPDNVLDDEISSTLTVAEQAGVYVISDWTNVGEAVEEHSSTKCCYFSFTPTETANYTFCAAPYNRTFPYYFDENGEKCYLEHCDKFVVGTTYYFKLAQQSSDEKNTLYVYKGGYTFTVSGAYSNGKKLSFIPQDSTEENYTFQYDYKNNVTFTISPNTTENRTLYYSYNWSSTSNSGTNESFDASFSSTSDTCGCVIYIYSDAEKNELKSTKSIRFTPIFNTLTSVDVNGETSECVCYTGIYGTSYGFKNVGLQPSKGEDYTITLTPASSLAESASFSYAWYENSTEVSDTNTYTIKTITEQKYYSVSISDGVSSAYLSITVTPVEIEDGGVVIPTKTEVNSVTHYTEAYSDDSTTHIAGYPITIGLAIPSSYFDGTNYWSPSLQVSNLKIDGVATELSGETFTESGEFKLDTISNTDSDLEDNTRFLACIGYYNLSVGTHTVSVDVSLKASGRTENNSNSYIVYSLGDAKTITGNVVVEDEIQTSKKASFSKTMTVDAEDNTTEYSYFSFYKKDSSATVSEISIYKHLDGSNTTYADADKVGTGTVKDTNTSDYSTRGYGNYGSFTYNTTYSGVSYGGYKTLYYGGSVICEPAAYSSSVWTNLTVDISQISSKTNLDIVITLSDGSKFYAKNALLYNDGTAKILKSAYGYQDTSNYVINANSAGDYISVMIYGKKLDGSLIPAFYSSSDCKESEVVASYVSSDSKCGSISDDENSMCYITLKKDASAFAKMSGSEIYFKLPNGLDASVSSYNDYGVIDLSDSILYAAEYTDAGLRVRFGDTSLGNEGAKVTVELSDKSGSFTIKKDTLGLYVDIPKSNSIYKALSSATVYNGVEISNSSNSESAWCEINKAWKADTVSSIVIPNAGSTWKLCYAAGNGVAEVALDGGSTATTSANQTVLTAEQITTAGLATGETYKLIITNAKGYTTIKTIYFDASAKTAVLDGNGGTFDGETTKSVTVKQGEKYGTLPTPSKTGYTFTGYATTKDGTASITSSTVVSIDGTSQTLYATWRKNTYTICYNANGGKGSSVKQSANYDEEVTIYTDSETKFTRDGYKFAGWNLLSSPSDTTGNIAAGSKQKNLTTDDKMTVNLFAQWTALKYTVTLHACDSAAKAGTVGSDGAKITLGFDDTLYLTGREFVQDGKTISGWSLTEGGKVKYKNTALTGLSKTENANIDLYAVWTNGKYNISYVLGTNGKGSNASTYEYDKKDIVLNNPTRAGYKFNGWTVSGTGLSYLKSLSAVDSSNLLTTKNSADKYIIPKGAQGDITLTANWNAISYTVTYDADGGTTSLTSTTATYDTTSTVSASAFTKSGYELTGFSTKKNGKGIKLSATDEAGTSYSLAGLSTKDGSSVTVYPTWKLLTYTITYEVGEGTLAKNATEYTVTKQIKVKNPTRPGYVFAGWTVTGGTITKTESEKTKALTIEKGSYGNVTLTANWTVGDSYTVTINKGSGNYSGTTTFANVSPDSSKLTSEQKIAVGSFSKNTTKGKVWILKGLCTSSSGKGTYAKVDNGYFLLSDLPSSKGKVTLYAIWKNNEYNVTYSSNVTVEGFKMKNSNPKTVAYSGSGVIKLKNASATGYTFNSWTNASGTQVYQLSKNSTEDVALVANFTPNTYTLKLNPNGATNTNQTVSFDMKYDEAIDLTTVGSGDNAIDYRSFYQRTGYIFKGFSTKKSGKTLDATNIINLTAKNKATVNLYPVWEKITTTKVSKVTAAKNGSGIDITYGKVKGTVTRYEIQYSTAINMADSTVATPTADATSYTLTDGLTSGKTYYIRVREVKVDSCGSNYYGKWSDIKTVEY